MIVNGNKISLEAPVTVAAFLEEKGYLKSRVVVEKNGDIVPKASFETVFLDDRDEIEIVHFVGGG
ncbi:MAG: sulfur carrier protein ThiS [Lachnospiraceae bacterium]|nr:sulfur carrier protein ThiS [Lachnospiraceae bacterium]